MRDFSIGESISYGWKLVRENLGLATRLSFIGFGLSLTSSFLNALGDTNVISDKLVFSFTAVAVSFLGILVHIGFFKMGFQLMEGVKPQMKTLLSYTKYFWRYIGAAIFFGLIISLVAAVFVSLIFLIYAFIGYDIILSLGFLGIFLGIIAGVKFFFIFPLIIDKDLSLLEAIKTSYLMTKGLSLQLIAFGVVLGLTNLLGAVVAGVGLLISAPVTFLVYLFLYRRLLAPEKEPEPILPVVLPPPEVPVHTLS